MWVLAPTALLPGAGAAGAAGRIDIVLKRRPDGAVAVSVADSGDGLPAGFQAGRDGGVGLRNALAMAEQQLSGRLDFSSESGLRADLVFAVAAAPTAQNRRAGFPRRRPIA
jgi:two-component sensor histidine kinase